MNIQTQSMGSGRVGAELGHQDEADGHDRQPDEDDGLYGRSATTIWPGDDRATIRPSEERQDLVARVRRR